MLQLAVPSGSFCQDTGPMAEDASCYGLCLEKRCAGLFVESVLFGWGTVAVVFW